MRAMILAAGLGTRMRPLTNFIPKSLVPIFNIPLIRFTLDVLKKANIREVIINLHHLPDPLKAYLSSLKELDISFSYEPKILGTGGGILRAKSFFQNKRFVVINSDIIMNINLEDVLEFHKNHHALATMVVRKLKPTETYDAIGMDKTGRMIKFKSKMIKPPLIKTMFTGVHIFEPEIFDYFPRNKKIFCINEEVYAKLVPQEKYNLYGFLHKGFWYDLGSLSLYFKYLGSNTFKKDIKSFFHLF